MINGRKLFMVRKRDCKEMISIFYSPFLIPSYVYLTIRATVSTCMVWGNMSTGWTFLRV